MQLLARAPALLGFLAILFSAPAFAGYRISTDYVLRVPNSLVDKLAASAAPLKGEKAFPLSGAAFELAGAKVSLSGIEAKVAYELAPPERLPGKERAWKVGTKRLSGSLTVGRMLVGRREVKEAGGVVLDHDITVECRNVRLRLKEEAGAALSGTVSAGLRDGKMQLALSDYASHWPRGAWAVDSLDCPAVAGIAGTIASEILSALADTSLLDSQLKPALEGVLLAAGEQASRELLGQLSLPSGIPGLEITAEGGSVTEIPGGFAMAGRLHFHFEKARSEEREELKLGTGEVAYARLGASPQLILPFSALSAILRGAQLAGLLRHDAQSRELEGFQALTRSRFRQFFAWPDLRRFERGTNFLFRVTPLEAPRLLNERAGRGGAILGQLDLPLSIRMFAPIERRWFPYVEFRTRLSAGASFRLERGNVKIKLNASGQPLTHAFSREYSERFRPRTRISTGRIRDSLVESLNQNEISLALPALKVAGLALAPSSWGLIGAGEEKALKLEFGAR